MTVYLRSYICVSVIKQAHKGYCDLPPVRAFVLF